ncbi:hypothetical protein ACB092_M016300 [Castanea dentata]
MLQIVRHFLTQSLVVILINTTVFVQMMRRSRATRACTWMAPGHRNARLTLLPSHPTPLAITIVQNTHPVLKPALGPYHPLGCLPYCSAALPTTVAIYLYPHLANRPHL